MNKHGTYTSNKRKPNTSGLGEYEDRDLLQELVERGVIENIIGEKPVWNNRMTHEETLEISGQEQMYEEQHQRIQTILKGGE